jgi:hypothetical protein
MVTTTSVIDRLDIPILIGGMTWREFKATEQLLARPGVRLFDRSQVLPSLDIQLLVSCIDIPNHLQTIK